MEPATQTLPTPDENAARDAARRSYTGQRLTESQFEESWAIAKILDGEIRKSGAFKEKLADYAHAFARTERFDAMKGETIIRDIFRERYGETLNQRREALMEREQRLDEFATKEALALARTVPELIQTGETMPFYRAYDIQSGTLAEAFQITQTKAKQMMTETFAEAEGKELYTVAKEVEERVHKPKVEAERRARQAERQGQSRAPARQMRYEP